MSGLFFHLSFIILDLLVSYFNLFAINKPNQFVYINTPAVSNES